MAEFKYTVTIECETEEQAQQVMAERLGCDEDYGFEYSVDYDDRVDFKQGDWVFYKGKPRQVYRFLPFGPTTEYPAIVRDPRFDQVELLDIKRLVPASEVRRMTIEGMA